MYLECEPLNIEDCDTCVFAQECWGGNSPQAEKRKICPICGRSVNISEWLSGTCLQCAGGNDKIQNITALRGSHLFAAGAPNVSKLERGVEMKDTDGCVMLMVIIIGFWLLVSCGCWLIVVVLT